MKSLPILLISFFMFAFTANAVPPLNSLPAARATIYLDFDGQVVSNTIWNGGRRIDCLPPPLTNTQITEIFNRVSEDFIPFEINITTEESKFLAAPPNMRMRVIITPTSSWYQGVGGIAAVGSFTSLEDIPCFVFSDRLQSNAKFIAECCSHESGHTLGLTHQSTWDANCQLVESYASGTGSGQTSWAPIMGNSYYKNMTGWDFGPTRYGCTITQDNLGIITTMNGFNYRQDDHPDDLASLNMTEVYNSFTTKGIISTSLDKDVFRFEVSQSAAFRLEVIPYGLNTNNSGANLDVKMELYNSSRALIATYDPRDRMNIAADTTLVAGKYYIVVSGTGNNNTDDYGSIGTYTLMALRGVLPIQDITLFGSAVDDRHELRWRVTADEPAKKLYVEVSNDGADFRTLAEVSPTSEFHSYRPGTSQILYYRIRGISQADQITYSGTVALRSTNAPTSRFLISNLVRETITVTASESFNYRLADINGRILSTGNGGRGSNRINMMQHPGGMYILQVFSNNEIITERIVKQ